MISIHNEHLSHIEFGSRFYSIVIVVEIRAHIFLRWFQRSFRKKKKKMEFCFLIF